MKKQSKLTGGGKKLYLSKTTISNLKAAEMNKKIAGGFSLTYCIRQTCKGNTCVHHNTCL